MTTLVTFSDAQMLRSAAVCISSAMAHGVDGYRHLTPEPLKDWSIVRDNPLVFRQPEDARRAWSWWAFKPLIIENTMQFCNDGDLIIYADAGIEFVNNVSHIIDRMDQDIFLFGNNWEHAHWCKRDIVDAVWPEHVVGKSRVPWLTNELKELMQPVIRSQFDGDGYCWSRFGKQVQASVIFFRVSDYSRKFVNEWLQWCLTGSLSFTDGEVRHPKDYCYLIDDSPSRTPNHPEFQENRHDQAILTTLAYREGIKLHYWPASYNDGAFTYPRGDYPDEGYPVLFHHHRRRNHEWSNAA